MNLVVTAVPFSEDDIHAHMDTSSGELVLDVGHLEVQDLKVTVDYDTAKAILVEGNPQAGMQAFMAGKVRVEGDMAKLMALPAAPRPATRAPASWPPACATSPPQTTPDAPSGGVCCQRPGPCMTRQWPDERAAHHRQRGHAGADPRTGR